MRTAIAFLMVLTLSAGAQEAANTGEAELKERALKLNREATNEDAANSRLRELNKDKENTPKLVRVAAQVLQEAKEGQKPFRFYPALVLAKAAHQAREYDAAEAFYQFCADTAIKDLQSGKLILLAGNAQIDFYMSRKQYPKAIKVCERLLDIEDESVQSQSLFLLDRKYRAMARNGEADAALDQLAEITRRARGGLLFDAMKAGLQREAGRLDDAVTTYKSVLEKLEEADIADEARKSFGSSIRYSLSGVYTELNRIDLAAVELEHLIRTNPDVPTYKNDLGFIWADNDMYLDKAEQLIRDAVEMDLKNNKKLAEQGRMDAEQAKKANSAFLDSLGWVLYKKKKYDEALKYLLEAVGDDDEESDHIEIWDHVGDCYLALDKKQEALEAFQRALKAEDITKKDAERRRRVTEKMNRLKRELK